MREGGKDMARPREVMLENFETCVRHLGMRITVWERKVRVLEGAVERNRWMWREDGVRFRARWGVEESDDEDEFGGRVDEGVSFVREMRRVRRERKKQKEMEQMQNQGSGAPLTQVNSADEGVGHMA